MLTPPAHWPPFIARDAKAAEVLSHLSRRDTSGLVALHGPAGFGKTRLLDRLCHDPVVRDRFPDGILKVELRSPSPAELRETVLDACYRISRERPPILTLPQAGEHLGSLLSDRHVLLFLDDVWNVSDLEPFLTGGETCGRVMTTRDVLAIPPGWTPVQIDAMTDPEAFALLRFGLEDRITRSEDVADILARSGRWPLLLRLLNGSLRDEMLRVGRSAGDALAFVLRFLQEGGPARDQQISAAIEASLGRLESTVSQGALERFRKLSIFPEEVQIPVDPVLPLVWGLPAFDVELEIRRFAQLSLIESFDPEASTVRLHTVIRDYLRNRNKHQLPIWNQQLLDAYRTSLSKGSTWYGLAFDHEYLWQNLAHHLREAGLWAELVSTITDLRYLSKRTYQFGPTAADTDLRHGQACSPGNELIFALQAIFRGSPRRLSGFRRRSDLAATLAAQLQGVSAAVGLVPQLLSSLEPPFLRVEWMAGEKPHPVLGWHDGPVNAAACDAAGTRAASAGADGAVRIWDMTPEMTEPFIQALQCHAGPVNSLSFDGAGTRLATAGADGAVCVLALAPGQIRLVTVLRGHAAEVNAATFDGAGVRVASAGADGTIRIWRRQEANDYTDEARLPGRHQFVNAVSFDPTGTLLAAGAADGWVSVWRFEGGEWREVWARQAHHPDPVNSVSFDRLGTLVVSAGADGTVQLLDAATGDERLRWLAHDGTAVLSVKFDGLGSRVVSGGADGSIRIWDADSAHLVAASDLSGGFVKSVACDDSGTRVVSGGSDGAVRVFAPVTLEPITNEWAGMIKSVSISPQGDRVAAGRRDGAIRVLDVRSGEQRAVLEGHRPFVNSVAWDASGERIVSAGADGSVRIWDAMSGQECQRLERLGPRTSAPQEVNGARFDRSGLRVVSGGADGVVRIWDAGSGEQVLTLVGHGTSGGADGQVNAVSFDPSGTKVLSAGADGTLRIWDLESGEESGRLVGHMRWVHRACFDADGGRVVSGAYEGDARLWDVATREERHTLATGNWVAFADFDPAGRWVAVGNGGGAVQIWDFRSDTLLTELRLDCSIFDGACGPDGTIAVGTGYGVYLLRLVSSADG